MRLTTLMFPPNAAKCNTLAPPYKTTQQII